MCRSEGNSTGGGVGGLVGSTCGEIEASYAVGPVSGTVAAGGLVGTGRSLRVRFSYWDLDTSGRRVGVGSHDVNDNGVIDGTESPRIGVAGMTTSELQAPTDYEDIFETWNVDLNPPFIGEGEADDPWDFGTATQYPVLSRDLNGVGGATWQEFGYQIRTGPTLTASTSDGQAQVNLSWTAADLSSWSPAPGNTYTVTRDNGTTVEMIAQGLTGTAYNDTGVTTGRRYIYQLTVVVDGGEAARSAPVAVTAGRANQPPVAVGTLANRSLQVGSMASVVVEVAGAFSDPDNDTLTYGASSSPSSVASVSQSGSQVTVTPGVAGRATVTVTATDAGGSNTSATHRFTVTVGNNYDSDGDGLIEISSLAQLDAVHHDLNGNGIPDYSDDAAAYVAAFPSPFDRMGCSFEGCSGYELEADLDLDTNGSGDADAGRCVLERRRRLGADRPARVRFLSDADRSLPHDVRGQRAFHLQPVRQPRQLFRSVRWGCSGRCRREPQTDRCGRDGHRSCRRIDRGQSGPRHQRPDLGTGVRRAAGRRSDRGQSATHPPRQQLCGGHEHGTADGVSSRGRFGHHF